MTEKLDPRWHDSVTVRIAEDDKETRERAAGLIAAGRAVVVSDLSLAERNQARALVGVLLAEAALEAEAEETMARISAENAARAKRRAASRSQEPKSAQQLFDEWDRSGIPKATRPVVSKGPTPGTLQVDRRMPGPDEKAPAKVSRNDPLAVGRWAAAIACGKTKVE